MWIGGKWQIGSILPLVRDADIKIALIHHPRNWLPQQDEQSFWPAMQAHFDFFLHGHEHHGWVHQDGRFVRIAAGASYHRHDKETGYSFVRLNIDEGTAEIWLRQFQEDSGRWAQRIIPTRTTDQGMLRLTGFPWKSRDHPQQVPVAPSRMMGRSTEVLLRYS